MPIAFQDLYADEFSHCYGCGRNNPHGHQLKSYWHECHPDGERTVARFTADARYSGGVPGHVYGGLIASLLDCHGTASATAFSWRAQNPTIDAMDAIDDGQWPLRCVTATLKVDYLRPTPIGVELTIEGELRAIDGRKVWVDLTLSADGQVCARGGMLAIALAGGRASGDSPAVKAP